MTQPDGYEIPVGLDTSGVVSGAQQGEDAVNGLQAALAGLTIGTVAAGRGLDVISAKAGRNLFGSASITAAAAFQSQMSGLAATAAVTGQRLSTFEGNVRSLARSMPGGTQAAIATVTAVQALGLAAKNQQSQIAALSTEFTKLGAAVGEAGPEVATAFGTLNRELASLDPSRVAKFSDVLTTLHATSGASALAIIGFSRAIAPVAQAAGLGESSILGISTAFTKLGDDGGAAATAVNKILTDLNESVREGTNQMTAYANATGMTVGQFRKLFESNPAQALTKVTGALANAGKGAPFLLQTLGLDPTRTQRALLELSQSGGLQAQIQTSVGAYGSGSTNKAAAHAFNNLNDSMQVLGTTAGQLSSAFGRPLLTPLKTFVDLAEGLVRPLAALANTGVGQAGIMGLLGTVAAAKFGGIAFKGASKAGTLAMAYSAASSGPIAAFLGGRRDVQGSGLYAEGTFGAKHYNDIIGAGMAGLPMGSPSMQNINRRAFNLGKGMFGEGGWNGSEAWANSQAVVAAKAITEGRNPLRMALGGASMGFGGYLNMNTQMFKNATRNAADRSFSMLAPGGPTAALMEGLKSGDTQVRGAALRDFAAELEKASKSTSLFRDAVTNTAKYMWSFGQFGVGTISKVGQAGGGLAGRGLGALGGALMSPLGAVVGAGALGFGAYEGFKSASNYNQRNAASYQDQDVYGVLNKYLDALGQAGVATQTMAQQIAAASTTIASTVTTHAQAARVTTADTESWGAPNKSKIINRMTGSTSQVAAQINAANLGGVSPGVLEGIKGDLHNQGYTDSQIDAILAQVPGTGSGQVNQKTITGLVSHIASNSNGNQGAFSWLHSINAFKRGAWGGPGSDWNVVGEAGAGHPNLNAQGTQTLHALVGTIGQGYSANQTAGRGTRFSQQTALSQANQIMEAALKTGNANTVVATEQALTASLTGVKHGITGVTAQQIQMAGGLSGLIQSRGDKVYGATIASLGGPLTPGHETPQNITALHGQARGLFGQYYGGGTGGVTGMVTRAAGEDVGNPAVLSKTAIAVVAALSASGSTMNAIATAATKSLNSTSAGQKTVQQAILSQAQYVQGTQQIGMNQGQLLASQSNQAIGLMSAQGPGSTAQYQQGQTLAQQVIASTTQYYQQRIMAQRNYEIQVGRADHDFNLSRARSEQDFQRTSLRNQQDYLRSLSRAIQDAESTEYNPYTRIDAQPVFSAGELSANLREQNQALVSQKRNLSAARGDGLSGAAIRVLGLAQTSNAQQLQQLVTEFASDPNVVKSINDEISKRGGATKSLFTDQGNTTYQRQKQDYDRAVGRLHADFALSQSRASQDFATQSARMAQDLHTSDLQITGNMTTLQKDMVKILHGQTVDWSGALVDMLSTTITKMKPKIDTIERLANGASANVARNSSSALSGISGNSNPTGGPTLGLSGSVNAGGKSVGNSPTTISRSLPGIGTVKTQGYAAPGTASTTTTNLVNDELPSDAYVQAHPVNVAFNKGIARSMLSKFGWGGKNAQAEFDALDWIWGGHESGWNQYARNGGRGGLNSTDDPDHFGQTAYGIPQSYPGNKMKSDGRDWRTNPATQILWGLQYIKGKYGDPVNAKNHYVIGGGYAKGGIAFGPQHMTIGEGGSPELALPLNKQGSDFLVGAMKTYIGADDARTITSGGQAMAVTINKQTYHYDSRQQFSGPMSFELTDPESLGKQLAKKQRVDNLTATRGGPAGA